LRPLKEYKGHKNYANDIKSPQKGLFGVKPFLKIIEKKKFIS